MSASIDVSASSGSIVEELIRSYENHPAWSDPRGLVWTAFFDSRVCPTCLVLDGTRYQLGVPGPCFDGETKISPHEECRCYLLPWIWRNDIIQGPNGPRPTNRPVKGDRRTIQAIPFTVTAEEWLRSNPKTATKIFGKTIAESFLGLDVNGLPLPPIPLEWAEKRWREQQEKVMQRIREREAREHALAEERARLRRQHREQRRREKEKKQLAILYEKEGRLSDALALCRDALDAGWDGDWDRRMGRLEKRLSKSQQADPSL